MGVLTREEEEEEDKEEEEVLVSPSGQTNTSMGPLLLNRCILNVCNE